MLTTEIKINGVVIAVLTLKNTGMSIKEEMMYSLESYIPNDEYENGKLINTSVSHNPQDGAIKLVQIAVNRTLELLKKDS